MTPFAPHNQTHQMFSPTVVLYINKKKNRVRIFCTASQRRSNLSNHMGAKSRTHLLSHGCRSSERPSRLFLYISLTLAETSLDLKRFSLHRDANALHCERWLPWGCGVKTGKHDNGYTCCALWALQWPLCVLTLLPCSYKSHPERFMDSLVKSLQMYLVGGAAATTTRR